MSDLIQLVYVSQATKDFEDAELTRLLEGIRPNNGKLGISGMLLYDGGAFMQVLEGDREVLENLYERIECDPRHTGLVKILQKTIAKRQFPDWTMGFSTISDEMLESVDGLNDFFRAKTCLTQVDAGRAVKILSSFEKGSWR